MFVRKPGKWQLHSISKTERYRKENNIIMIQFLLNI